MIDLKKWVEWAFQPSTHRHRFCFTVLARHASRDIGRYVSAMELASAMGAAGYSTAEIPDVGTCPLAWNSENREVYEFRRYILWDENVRHPLCRIDYPTQAEDAFRALPEQDQENFLNWVRENLMPIRRTWSDFQLQDTYEVLIGQQIAVDAFRGGLIVASYTPANYGEGVWRFRVRPCAETYMAYIRARRETDPCAIPEWIRNAENEDECRP